MDRPPISSPTALGRRARLHTRQIGGLPPVYSCPLSVVHATEGVSPLVQAATKLHVGFLVEADGYVSFGGVLVPDFQFRVAHLMVEFTSVDDEPEAPSCSISATYLDSVGKSHRLFTPPLLAAGDLAEFEVSQGRLARNRVLSLNVGFALTSFHADDPSKKRPILFRGAWLQFPE